MPFDVDAPVLANRRLSADYNTIVLAAPEIAQLAAPGQFVMVKPTPAFDPLLRRPFSIFEIVRDETGEPSGISLLNKAIGVGTRLLYGLTPGDRVACLGPLGRPFAEAPLSGRAVMVAGGVGLAPFATLAERLRASGTPATLVYGGRRAEDLYYVDLFESLGVDLLLTTEDGRRGERGLVTAPLERLLRETALSTPLVLYACGPTPMMRAVAALAARYGRPCQVSLEPLMGCGLGGCFSCVVPLRENGAWHYTRACIEGPVFDSTRVVWDALAEP